MASVRHGRCLSRVGRSIRAIRVLLSTGLTLNGGRGRRGARSSYGVTGLRTLISGLAKRLRTHEHGVRNGGGSEVSLNSSSV